MGLCLGIAAIVCLLTAGFFAGAEMGLYCLNRVRLRLRAGSAVKSKDATHSQLLLELSNQRQETVLAVLLLQNVFGYLLTVVAAHWVIHVFHLGADQAEFYSALILAPLVFVFGDVVPKNWFQMEADRLMYPCAPLLGVSVKLFRLTGLPWVLELVSRVVARLVEEDERKDWLGSRGEVLGLLRESAAEGAITEEQTKIVERVLNLSRVAIRSILIPRRTVVTVPVDANRQQFARIVRGHNYSRMPVMSRDGRTVVGIVHVADVLADPGEFELRKFMQPPLVIAAHESAASALVKIQQAEAPMGIVVDTRQTFLGIVTLKDVVEEIFGELPAW